MQHQSSQSNGAARSLNIGSSGPSGDGDVAADEDVSGPAEIDEVNGTSNAGSVSVSAPTTPTTAGAA
ncbi:unnamed protein product, partial [Protopolystoma xenopodis]